MLAGYDATDRWRPEAHLRSFGAEVVPMGARIAAAVYDGKLFRQTLDAHVVALDMKTGKEGCRGVVVWCR